MEMKHLGLTLRATVCAQSPGAGLHWAPPRRVRTPFVMWAYVSTCAHVHTVSIGWDPVGCQVKVTFGGKAGGGRGHLLAGSGKTRVTAIHLSENTLTQDSICTAPLGDLRPRGPYDPHCLPVDWASCPTSPGSAETATAHLWPQAILGNCNAVQYIEGFHSRRLQFSLGLHSFFFFK